MGLIKNSVQQGRQAVENILKAGKKPHNASYDIIVVGAGPAGISAALTAKKHNLKCLTLEQDTLGGTVFSFPRAKIVMTSPMDLPLYGRIKLHETTKPELLELWKDVIKKNNVEIKENSKVETIVAGNGYFEVETLGGEKYTSRFIVLAIGRRGSPRKLGIPGEGMEKVAYRLLEPEIISNKDIMVVGGGDSAIEAALQLCENNRVILSYRGDAFSRIKPKNKERIEEALGQGLIDMKLNTKLLSIEQDEVILASGEEGKEKVRLRNDLVYVFAGGELPTQFLVKIGLQITKKFGEAVLKHK